MPNSILHWYVKFFLYFFDPSLFRYVFLNSDFQTYLQGQEYEDQDTFCPIHEI